MRCATVRAVVVFGKQVAPLSRPGVDVACSCVIEGVPARKQRKLCRVQPIPAKIMALGPNLDESPEWQSMGVILASRCLNAGLNRTEPISNLQQQQRLSIRIFYVLPLGLEPRIAVCLGRCSQRG